MGLLHADRIGRATVCTHDEVERFRSRYCLTSEACRILQIHPHTLTRWETEGLIRPVYGPRVKPGAGISVYLRADLDRLKSERLVRRTPRAA